MKHNILIFSLVFLFGNFAALSAQAKKAESNTAVTTFNVSLHCAACKSKIEKNISWEKGVKDLSVDLDKKTVTVTYDTRKIDKQTLQKAIEKLGYTCSEQVAAAGECQKSGCKKDAEQKQGCCKQKAEGEKTCAKAAEHKACNAEKK
ncbi:MAG: heavy-metal-associated domain-containing protein [Prevotellaceae bacterium]|jgi:copper chaperone CopZ|nr:heavy-metal-associated domain-containing protein [Prevotellaceae bacterium]